MWCLGVAWGQEVLWSGRGAVQELGKALRRRKQGGKCGWGGGLPNGMQAYFLASLTAASEAKCWKISACLSRKFRRWRARSACAWDHTVHKL